MAQDNLLKRLDRIYMAINTTVEFDMTKLPAKVFRGGGVVGFFQDFSGGRSEQEIENVAQSVIHNIASLRDHLKKWAPANGKDKKKVDSTFYNSEDLMLITDLWDNDKHGYPRRDGGYTKRSPKLNTVRSQMVYKPQPKAGSPVIMTFGAGGIPKIGGDSTAYAVITGDVVDKDGKKIGDLFNIEERAVKAWELLLQDYGLLPQPQSE